MAQTEKRENSVLFSLRELRQIEENRVQEEEEAVRRDREAKLRAEQDEARRIREAEDARIKSERDEQVRIENARESAEREARMHVEAHEAAERQKHQAALEQERLQHEMAIRREEARKKRPTWMLAVTAIALIGAIGFIYWGIQSKNQSEADEKRAAAAEEESKKATIAARDAREKLESVQKSLDELDGKVAKAVSDVANAKDRADILAAQNRLAELQKEQYEMRKRVAEAKDAAARAERAKGLHISEECKANPLAKGCS
jgi:hypothetical protein